jgi:iron-sulfur cluster repair protein YtfE (RIC family)
MKTLTDVSHEHHDLLWQDMGRMRDIALCLDSDCLDRAELRARLPLLREIHEGLSTRLLPHMEAVEAAVYPTLERLVADHGATTVMAEEHEEVRRLMRQLGQYLDDPDAPEDRASVLVLRRIVLRLYALLTTHLAEESLYLPILEDRLTEGQEAALARALDHLAAERL